jgi:hypothetical protein
MFDLEQSIATWRRQMLAAGIKISALDELESHVREAIKQQCKLGIAERDAFKIAIGEIGSMKELRTEFAKAGKAKWAAWQKLKRLLGFDKTPAFENFAPAAIQALGFAAGEARGFHHNYIGTEHVLLGLIKSESKVVSKVIQRLGVEDKALRGEIEKFLGQGQPHEVSTNIPYTPRVKRALGLAACEARALNQPHINPEHIFLGLILESGGFAGRALKNLGIQIGTARQEVLREMGMA